MWLADIDPSALGGSSLIGVVMLALWIVYTQIKNPQTQITKTDTAKFDKVTMVLESLVRQTQRLEEQHSKHAAINELILKQMQVEQHRSNDILERVIILLERNAAKRDTPSSQHLKSYKPTEDDV